jgi:hypothetical protein
MLGLIVQNVSNRICRRDRSLLAAAREEPTSALATVAGSLVLQALDGWNGGGNCWAVVARTTASEGLRDARAGKGKATSWRAQASG